MVSERDSAVEHLPVGNEELQKQAAQPFPQVFRAALLFLRRPARPATSRGILSKQPRTMGSNLGALSVLRNRDLVMIPYPRHENPFV